VIVKEYSPALLATRPNHTADALPMLTLIFVH
jgi:hypothetical protein